jgi:hypothetical protein
MANNTLVHIPLKSPWPDFTEHLSKKEIHDGLSLAIKQGGGQIITVG